MEKVRLGDICDVRDGTHDSPKYHDRGYPLVTSKNLSKGYVDFSDCNLISKEDYDKINIRSKVNVGDILMPMIGTVGNPVIVQIEPKFAIKNVALIKFYKDSKVLNKYIKVLLESNYFDRMVISKIRGGTQKFISLNDIRGLEIILPTISEQLEIVDRIEKINALIGIRKEQFEKLNELVKARFVELFGERLEKETVKLSTLTEVITKGTTPTTHGFEFTESGINFVKIECITEDSNFIVSKMLHISDKCNQKLKRSILQENDILFSIAGAIGRTAIVTKEILPANTNQALAIIRLKANCGLNVHFLNQMLHSSLIEKQVNVKKAGVAQINLSLADIGDFNVVVPPIEEQNQFSTFVEQTDKSKLEVQKSLEKFELLKKALMQKYFG